MQGIFGFGTLFKLLLDSSYHKLIANSTVDLTRTIKGFEGIVLAFTILSFVKFHSPSCLSSIFKSSLKKNPRYL